MTGSGPAGVNDLIGWLGNARLQPARQGPGYHAGDVDAFLGEIVEALGRGEQPDPERVRLVQFPVTRMRPGYDRQGVGRLLDELQRRLRGPEVPGDQPGPAGSSPAAALMERISRAKFGMTRRAPGYDAEDVDTFLDEVMATLGRGEPLRPAEVRGTQFRTTRMRPGYVQQDVDNLLGQIERYAGGYGL